MNKYSYLVAGVGIVAMVVGAYYYIIPVWQETKIMANNYSERVATDLRNNKNLYKKERILSGVTKITDLTTGCAYISNRRGIAPLLKENGNPMCSKESVGK